MFHFSGHQSELLDILQEIENEFHQASLIEKQSGYSRNSEEYQESETIWKTRMETKEREFKEQRHHLFERIEENICFSDTFCESCRSPQAYVVRCNKCREHLCVNCDFEKHRKLFTHRRTYLSLDNQLVVLRPTEFVNLEGTITITGSNHCIFIVSNI